MASNYNLRALREFITECFDKDELRLFTSDFFPEFYKTIWNPEIKRVILVQDLIEYCLRRGLIEILVKRLQIERPTKYANFIEKIQNQVKEYELKRPEDTGVVSIKADGNWNNMLPPQRQYFLISFSKVLEDVLEVPEGTIKIIHAESGSIHLKAIMPSEAIERGQSLNSETLEELGIVSFLDLQWAGIQKPDFRQAETEKLFKWMQAGESASIIGISSVGKSNLFNHICDPQTQALFLGKLAVNTIIVRANFHYIPDYSDRSVYSLLLEQLELLGDEAERLGLSQKDIEQINKYHEQLLDAKDDVLKVQHFFKLALRVLLARSHRRLVVILEHFDDVFQEAEPRLFANLRGIREAYKYRLSFLVFTRDMLPNLIDMDPRREEFYELLAFNIMGLKPYAMRDAMSVLERIAERNQIALTNKLRDSLYRLAGGHAGLLQAALLGVAQHNLEDKLHQPDATKRLLQVPGVEIECEKLWHSLSAQEQRTLLAIEQKFDVSMADSMILQLQIKGLLKEDYPVIFSPLFAQFVAAQEALWERPLFFDEPSRQIWVLGNPAPRLTQLEYRLFQQLYEQKGEIVEKDTLISAGWPKTQGGVSDEVLIAAIARLRKKLEPDSQNPRFLQSVHNQGYVLQSNDD
ncbi:MAG: winged helix-turn-helix transcriptional regulator [Ardenticatenaceae bacterium]|nr:winged helix-turn-helix transcriptional regulator [Ardenticatenaceae bacterium]